MSKYLGLVRELSCMVCGGAPVQAHHVMSGSIAAAGIVKGMAQKTSDWLALPLCLHHHTGNQGIHSIGVKTWEAKFGEQINMVWAMSIAVGYNLFLIAASPSHSAPVVNMIEAQRLVGNVRHPTTGDTLERAHRLVCRTLARSSRSGIQPGS